LVIDFEGITKAISALGGQLIKLIRGVECVNKGLRLEKKILFLCYIFYTNYPMEEYITL
jgi:hypothetical protein